MAWHKAWACCDRHGMAQGWAWHEASASDVNSESTQLVCLLTPDDADVDETIS